MNKKELKKIEEFRLSYSREKAIQWYTDECFLYKLLNNAIRTEDIELLYSFRFYIIDLCDALEKESKKLTVGSILTLYRGQQIPNDEFEKLRKNVGTLISTNGFLSTSRSIDVALQFTRRFRATNDMKTCIFEIRADPSMSAAVFADIEKFSTIKEEQEVLFGLNATFKIDCVKMDSTLQMWKVCLSTTAEGTSRIEQYMKLQEDEMKLSSPLIAFGRLLLNELGQTSRAAKYFNKLLRSLPPNHPDIHFVHNNIGNVYSDEGELNLALKHYEEAYRIRRSTFPADHPCIAASLNNIGLIYKDKNDFNRALEYLHKSLAIDEKNYSGDHSDKCHALLNIGIVHRLKVEFDDALIWLNRALNMYRRVRPAAHPDIACCLGELGSTYEDKNNLDLAIEFYRRRLEIEEECLPFEHPNLSTHLDRLARTYKKKSGKKMALDFCERKLASQKEALGESHPRIASTLMTMGDICKAEEQCRYYENALSVLENCTPRNELLTIECLEMLGAIALDGGKTGEGIGYWKYVLDISRQSHSPDHPKIAQRLERLGDAYFEAMHDYQEALRYFTESLIIYRKNYGNQHKDIINLEQTIGKVYEKSGDLARALECYQRALRFQKQSLPCGHMDISASIDTVALTYKKNEDIKGAMVFLEQEKAFQISTLGKNHPCIASTLMTIGDVFENERYQFYQKAFSILEESSPRDEIRTVACIEMLGALELDDNRFGDGFAHLMQALEIRRKMQPADENGIAHSLNMIGDAQFDHIQDYAEAVRYYLESLAVYRSNYLPQHPTVIEIEEKIQKARQNMASSE